MKGHSCGKVYGRDYVKPYVEIWEQPFWRLMIAKIYHRWDMSSWRFFRIFEKPHEALFCKDDEFYIPLTNRQDLRCDYLQHKGRKVLALVYITEEQYNAITKEKSSTQE